MKAKPLALLEHTLPGTELTPAISLLALAIQDVQKLQEGAQCLHFF